MNLKNNYSICVIFKKNKPYTKSIKKITERYFNKIDYIEGTANDNYPKKLLNKKYDFIFSYLSPWILNNKTLRNTTFYNINFHPGSPDFPGIGCYNFALYKKVKFYGATAHIMNEKVDTGSIIMVKKFKIIKKETVTSLIGKTYAEMVNLYEDVIKNLVMNNFRIKYLKKSWTKKPYTRDELNKLCKISTTMKKKEILQRVKATYYPGAPGPYIKIHGLNFEYININEN